MAIALKSTGIRQVKNSLAKWLITLGGISVLFTLVLIFMYLLYVIKPIFESAKIEQINQFSIVNATDTKVLASGLDELQNLCTQFLRIESFGKSDVNNVTQTLSFMTKDKSGHHHSFEGFTKFGLENDNEVKSAVNKVQLTIAEMPKEKQLATLTNLLSSLMAQPEKETSND